jgi:DNA polymerase-3 subunit alpha/error-prone DNA polymerase
MAILTKKLKLAPKDLVEYARTKGFVELCGRSNFSFLQGGSHPEELVEEAMRLGYDGFFLSDRDGLYGVARGYQTAKSPSLFQASVQGKVDFQYGLGVELTVQKKSNDGVCTLTLIPMDKHGYTLLCKLLTLGKRQAQKGFSRVTLAQVLEHSEQQLIFCEPEDFLELQPHCEDRLYIPIWRDLTWDSNQRNHQAFQLEQEHGAQLFVSQKPLYHSPERKVLFDVLTCIHHHTTLPEAKNILAQNAERYLRPVIEVYRLWTDRPDLVAATKEIANRVTFSLSEIRYRYPTSSLPQGLTSKEYLQKLTAEGLRWRFPQGIPQKVADLAKHELEIIQDLHYEDYFLTLYEICLFARSRNILHQGRGSAANSVVCFALGLTAVDPTQIDLLFERFISRERAEPPDIDIDFEHERREEVIQHIYEKYDEQHAAMVCTVVRFKSRMALREVAKAFGVPLATINQIIRFMGRDGIRRLLETEKVNERFQITDHTWKLILALAQVIHGFPRHLGIHTGGFIITQDPLNEMVPVEKATMQGRYVIQWNKDDVNFLGLMKIDVLSLGMLTALRKSLDILARKIGQNWNLAQIPQEDPATYAMICKADTVGVFQIESRAQMQTLPRLKPVTFYDLVVEVALIRPGPLQGGMVHPYLRRRQGLEKVQYPHPNLIPVLGKTLGVPIFQEQVMKIAVAAAGFTPGESDELRRTMSMAWRKKGTMEGLKTRILRGLKENGITDHFAQQIYKTIEGFANYGFPESHAASFALLTYASCYIKCHHPDVFTCALLNSQPMGFYPARVLIHDAQRHGVNFLPLTVQDSDYDYQWVSENQVRVGFRALHGVPQKMLDRMLTERARSAFTDLKDFIRRSALPKVVLMKLAAAGALSAFGEEPRKILWHLESVSLDPQSFLWGQARESFSDDAEDEDAAPVQESGWESLSREYSHQGFSLHSHPLSVLRPALQEQSQELRQKRLIPYFHSQDLDTIEDGQMVRLAGLVSVTQRPPTAKGMCFLTLEDEFGFMNIVVPPDIYQKDRITIYSKSLLEIRGCVQRRQSVINIKASRVFPLALF